MGLTEIAEERRGIRSDHGRRWLCVAGATWRLLATANDKSAGDGSLLASVF